MDGRAAWPWSRRRDEASYALSKGANGRLTASPMKKLLGICNETLDELLLLSQLRLGGVGPQLHYYNELSRNGFLAHRLHQAMASRPAWMLDLAASMLVHEDSDESDEGSSIPICNSSERLVSIHSYGRKGPALLALNPIKPRPRLWKTKDEDRSLIRELSHNFQGGWLAGRDKIRAGAPPPAALPS